MEDIEKQELEIYKVYVQILRKAHVLRTKDLTADELDFVIEFASYLSWEDSVKRTKEASLERLRKAHNSTAFQFAPSIADLNEQLQDLKEQDEQLQAGVNYWMNQSKKADKAIVTAYETVEVKDAEIARLQEQVEKLKEHNTQLERELQVSRDAGKALRKVINDAYNVPLCDANIPHITGHQLVEDMMKILEPYTD